MMTGATAWCANPANAVSGALLAGLGVAEIGLLSLAALVLFLRWGCTFAEAAASAMIVPLMALSLLFQAAFILGAHLPELILEAILCLAATWAVAVNRRHLGHAVRIAREFLSAHRLSAGLLLAAWAYLGIHAVANAPTTDHWELLNRILSWQAAGTFFSSEAPLPPVPINAMVLPHLFLRLGTCHGAGLFGVMAYMAIGCATYALARRHAWPPTAFTVALVTASLPRLVILSVSPGLEIIPAAAAVFSLLTLYRLVERPGRRDLALLVLGIFFSMPAENTFYFFPAILSLLSLVLLIRRHGTLIWSRLLRAHTWAVLGTISPALIFSQVWRLAGPLSANRVPGLSGPDAGAFYNTDGIQGAMANLMRYFLQSADFTAPLDRLVAWAMGFRPSGILQAVYDRIGLPLFDQLGSAAIFKIAWMPPGTDSWFGPFGFLLVLPALGYALARGSRRLKAVALALILYTYTICLACAWTPQNARFFTVVFACGGYCAAFLLPPWRFSRTGKRGIQAVSLLLLVYAAARIG